MYKMFFDGDKCFIYKVNIIFGEFFFVVFEIDNQYLIQVLNYLYIKNVFLCESFYYSSDDKNIIYFVLIEKWKVIVILLFFIN